MTTKTKVSVIGLCQMGRGHALAHHKHPGFKIVDLVNRSVPDLPEGLASCLLRC